MCSYMLLMLLISTWQSVSALRSMGKEFMVTTPRLRISLVKAEFRLKFHLSTFSLSQFKVSFSVPHYKEPVTEEILLRPGSVEKFTPDQTLVSDIEVGPTRTFRFVGKHHFGLTVVMLNSVGGLATFQALPVATWGKVYYVLTASKMPFILVTSADDDNKVYVTLSSYAGQMNAVFVYDNIIYQSQDTIQLALKRWESFVISNCSFGDGKEKYSARLDGTEVYSKKPTGVISGGCLTKVASITCADYKFTWDMMAEMLFPTSLSRRSFIFPNIPGRFEPGQLAYITWEAHANITIYNELTTDSRIYSGERVSMLPVFIKNYVVSSNTGILVLYVQTSDCEVLTKEPMDAGPNLCLIIPTEFFHYRFIWRTPDLGTKDFILIVARVTDTDHLLLDSKPLPVSLQWEVVFFASNYTVGNVPVSVGNHKLVSSKAFRFACYIYGIGKNSSYMHVAGFQTCGRAANTSVFGDLVDKDCDGQVEGHVSEKFLKQERNINQLLLFAIVPILPSTLILLCIAYKACAKGSSQAAVVSLEDVPVHAVFYEDEVTGSMVSSNHSGGSKLGGRSDAASTQGSNKQPSTSQFSSDI